MPYPKKKNSLIDAAPIRTIRMTLYGYCWGLGQCRACRHNNYLEARRLLVGHALACPEKTRASSARRDKLKHVLPKNIAVVSIARDAQRADP
jgi:hypothetical protein